MLFFTPLSLGFGSKGSKCLYDGPKPVQSLVARGYPNQISAQKQKKVNCTLETSLKHGRGRHIASYLTSRGRHIAPTIKNMILMGALRPKTRAQCTALGPQPCMAAEMLVYRTKHRRHPGTRYGSNFGGKYLKMCSTKNTKQLFRVIAELFFMKSSKKTFPIMLQYMYFENNDVWDIFWG